MRMPRQSLMPCSTPVRRNMNGPTKRLATVSRIWKRWGDSCILILPAIKHFPVWRSPSEVLRGMESWARGWETEIGNQCPYEPRCYRTISQEGGRCKWNVSFNSRMRWTPDTGLQIKNLTAAIEEREEKIQKKERQIHGARVRSFLTYPWPINLI